MLFLDIKHCYCEKVPGICGGSESVVLSNTITVVKLSLAIKAKTCRTGFPHHIQAPESRSIILFSIEDW